MTSTLGRALLDGGFAVLVGFAAIGVVRSADGGPVPATGAAGAGEPAPTPADAGLATEIDAILAADEAPSTTATDAYLVVVPKG